MTGRMEWGDVMDLEFKYCIEKALNDYQRLTGLRGYIVMDNEDINSASERNYFCKCLKTSTKALQECEICTLETFHAVKNAQKEMTYCCHAGLIKWAVPVKDGANSCVVMAEGVVSSKQLEESRDWIRHLKETYDVDDKVMEKAFQVVKVLNQSEMDASIQLLKDLIRFHLHYHRSTITV